MSKICIKKPEVAEFVQYPYNTLEEIVRFCSSFGEIIMNNNVPTLKLNDGSYRAIFQDDYILKDKSGLVAILSPDAFNSTWMELCL